MIEPTYKLQKDFPLIEEYSKVFDVTDRTVFAYDNCIYTNYQLPPDIVVHEKEHLKQQEKYGLEHWVTNYFVDLGFRLEMEVKAYRKQLMSIKDREFRFHVRRECAEHLSSGLYGNIINLEDALKILK